MHSKAQTSHIVLKFRCIGYLLWLWNILLLILKFWVTKILLSGAPIELMDYFVPKFRWKLFYQSVKTLRILKFFVSNYHTFGDRAQRKFNYIFVNFIQNTLKEILWTWNPRELTVISDLIVFWKPTFMKNQLYDALKENSQPLFCKLSFQQLQLWTVCKPFLHNQVTNIQIYFNPNLKSVLFIQLVISLYGTIQRM